MTKPKGKPAVRERATAGDQSNEGAGAERRSLRSKLRRELREAERYAATAAEVNPDGRSYWHEAGKVDMCDLLLTWLNGRSARYAARPGGLRGPGKGARRAQ